ncbi:MAG: fibronectin type III domain-containing protein [Bacteroidales bacterium]|nr:fibronectin type III domain-containing protein [Bacteroidales bacterium]
MKKQLTKLLVLFFTLVMGIGLQAQEIITIGDGTSFNSKSVPLSMYYGYTTSQTLYFQEEINMVGQITAISYYSNTAQNDEVEVWMAESEITSITSSSHLSANDMTKVFDGEVSFTANQWVTITLETPFVYSNTNNLVIGIIEKKPGYSGGTTTSGWQSTYGSDRAVYARNDSNPYSDFSSIDNSESAYPNIQLTMEPIAGFCFSPESIIVGSTEQTSAVINWVANEDNAPVNLQYTLATDTEWENATTLNNLSSLTATINNLTPNTPYKVRVQSICNNDGEETFSSWKETTFRTACAPLQLADIPYQNGFNSEEDMLCWSTPITNGIYPTVTSYNGYEGAGKLQMQALDMNLAVSPQINTNIENLRISFFGRVSSESYEKGTLEVGIMTDPNDLTTFESVAMFEDMGNTYSKYIVNFNNTTLSGIGKYIAFLYTAENSAQAYYIDNVDIAPIANCNGPVFNSLAVSNVNYATADLVWEDDNEENTSWVVYYKTNEENATWQTVTVSAKEYSFTTLLPETQYSVYVSALCSDGINTSYDHTNTVTFTTRPLCYAPTNVTKSNLTQTSVTLTWEDNSTATAWTVYYKESSASEWSTVSATERTATLNGLAANTSYSVKVKGNCSEEGNESSTLSFATPCEYVTLPYTTSFEDDNSSSVPACWTRANSTSYTAYPYVYNSSSYAKTGSKSLYWSYNTNTIALPIVDIIEHPINTLRVEFFSKVNSGTGSMEIGVVTDPYDATTFETVASVNLTNTYPTTAFGVNLTNYTGQGSYIAFRPVTSAYYLVDDVTLTVAPECYEPTITEVTIDGSNATVTWNDNSTSSAWSVSYKLSTDEEFTTVNNITEKTYTVPVQSSSTYQVKVTGNCGEEMASDVYTFKTPCDVVTSFPYVESFENATTSDWGCWTTEQISNNNWQIQTSGSADGTKHAHKTYSTGVADLISPIFDLSSVSNPTVSYSYKAMKDDALLDTLYVYYRTSSDAEWVLLANYQNMLNSDPWQEATIALTEVSSTFQIKFRASTHGGYGCRVDNFRIYNDVPSCKNPENVTANNITTGSATVTWNEINGTSTAWIVYYKPATAEEYTALPETNEMTIELTGLNDNTTYSVYVKGNCSNEAESTPITFTTEVIVPMVSTFPYTQDFEGEHSEISITGTNQNKWAIGSATGNAGNSLYVSNDNGETNAYTYNGSCNAYASMIVNFGDAAAYSLSFDWKGKGEDNWDFLNVYVLPEETTFPVGKQTSNSYAKFHQTAFQEDWTTETITLEGVTNQKRVIVFHWYNDSGSGTNPPASVDNISIVAETCAAPQNLALTENTATSSTIVWEDESESSSWTVEYKKSTETEYTTIENVTERTYTFTNLDVDGSSYNVKVTGNCGVNKTSAVYTFTTLSCKPVVKLYVDDITSSSATIHWEETGLSASWNVYYKPTSEIEETPTSFEGFLSATVNAEDTSATLSNLNGYTNYSVYVVGNCGESAVTSTNFTTLCGVYSLPYSQNFDQETNVLPDCWSMFLGAYNSNLAVYYPAMTTTGVSTGKGLELRSTPNLTAYAITPNFGEQSQLAVSFSAKARTLNGRNGTLQVGTMSDATDTTSFVLYGEVEATSLTMTPYNMLAIASEGEENHVAFRFYNENNTYYYVVDDLTVSATEFTVVTENEQTEENYTFTTTYPQGFDNVVSSGVEYKLASDEEYAMVENGSLAISSLVPNTAYNYRGFVTLQNGEKIYSLEGTFTTPCVETTITEPLTATICANSSYDFFGEEKTVAGTYNHVLEGANQYGCDSTVTLVLTVNPLNTKTEDVSVCYGTSYSFNGETWSTAGEYTTTVIATIEGACDTVYTINLTVLPQVTAIETITVCYGQTAEFNGQTLTEGENTVNVAGVNGECDTLYTVILNVLPQNTANETVTVCYGQTAEFNGQTLTEGENTVTVAGVDGECDTLYTVTLVVRPENTNVADITINPDELPYQFGTQVLEAEGTYTEIFTDENGCDSTVVLTLTVNSSINDVENGINVMLYPNPTTEDAMLRVEGINSDATIYVTDVQGRTIKETKLAQGESTIKIETSTLASGVYYIRIVTDTINRTEKLIKK